MRNGLRWLSRQDKWSCLHTSANQATTTGTETIEYPANFRVLDEIIINDGDYDYKPLSEISFEEYKKLRAEETSSNYGRPRQFARRGEKFYLYYVPDSNDGDNYTAKVYYWRYHPDETTILFSEDFEEVINNAVIAAYLEDKGRHSKAVYYQAKAKGQAEELSQRHCPDRKPTKIPYKDL